MTMQHDAVIVATAGLVNGSGLAPNRRGGGVAVASMCAGGGMATAVVLEVHAPA